jgi:putative endonuclease
MKPASKMATTQEQGKLAENLACQYLEKQGLQLLNKNYQCRFGELDLIMQDKDSLVFIEVRYRNHPGFGSGAETVTTNKQSKIIKTASEYLQRHAKLAKYPARFDVISMSGNLNGSIESNNASGLNIDWIKNAFDA